MRFRAQSFRWNRAALGRRRCLGRARKALKRSTCRFPLRSGAMTRENFAHLMAQAFERAAGYDNPWPDDLQAREAVRLLQEGSRDVIARMSTEDKER